MSVLSLTACIDEDTSDCGQNYTMAYRMKLNLNLKAVIDEELTSADEVKLKPAVEAALNTVFRPYATDNDLTFYNPTSRTIVRHEANKMDGATATYTLFLPARPYRHIALANVLAEPTLELENNDKLDAYVLQQIAAADTVESQKTGLFAARMDMNEQDFTHDLEVDLNMLNASTLVLIDRNGLVPDEVRGCSEGTATAFCLNDSIYAFNGRNLVRATHVAERTHDILYNVTLPSRDEAPESPYARAGLVPQDVWRFHVMVKLNGKFTESILHLTRPLKAGELRILKLTLRPDGSVSTSQPNVGVSVNLDWQPGGEHDIEM